MQLNTVLSIVFPILAAAQGPNDPGFYNTVAEIFSGPNCDPASKVWDDPIFGRGGSCQLLDRNDNTPDIYSYRVTWNYEGCSANLYTDDACGSTAYPATIGTCLTAPAGTPFVKAFVQCPFS